MISLTFSWITKNTTRSWLESYLTIVNFSGILIMHRYTDIEKQINIFLTKWFLNSAHHQFSVLNVIWVKGSQCPSKEQLHCYFPSLRNPKYLKWFLFSLMLSFNRITKDLNLYVLCLKSVGKCICYHVIYFYNFAKKSKTKGMMTMLRVTVMAMIAKGVRREIGGRKRWRRRKRKVESNVRIFMWLVIMSQVKRQSFFVIYQVGTTFLPLLYTELFMQFAPNAK